MAKQKLVTLIFVLSMPNCASWNGKWSGEGRRYLHLKQVPEGRAKELDGKHYYHSFGDGWGAGINVLMAKTSAEVRAAKQATEGFCMYEWMCDNIVSHGSTKAKEDIK